MKTSSVIFALILFLTGCSDGKEEIAQLTAENTKLKTENTSLKNQINSLNNEAPRQLSYIKSLINEKNLQGAREALAKLETSHPSSNEAITGSTLITTLEKELIETAKKNTALEKANAAKQQKALSNLEKSVDKISGTTWYQHKNRPHSEKYIAVYIGTRSDTGPFLRKYINYYSTEWLFVRDCTFHVDGQNYEMTLSEFKRDNSDGDIWEWSDTIATTSDIAVLKKIANSKETIIRFKGTNYSFDYEVEAGEKRQLQEMLLAFDSLNENRK